MPGIWTNDARAYGGGGGLKASALVVRLAAANDLPRYRAGFFLRSLVVELREELARGGGITIHGIGTFRVKRCSARMIDDFRGRPCVTPGRKMSFRPSKSLRRLLS
jgi:nucleoid DNA-binding protein